MDQINQMLQSRIRFEMKGRDRGDEKKEDVLGKGAQPEESEEKEKKAEEREEAKEDILERIEGKERRARIARVISGLMLIRRAPRKDAAKGRRRWSPIMRTDTTQ